MLTANKILKEMKKGNIEISPFNLDQLNPNSYNVRLSNVLKTYNTDGYNNIVLNTKNVSSLSTTEHIIPASGFLLTPGKLYLGSTVETISSDKYISAIDGRSSIGRLGIQIHSTAGFGDIGFSGNYTLEISVIEPVVVYPDTLIGQVYFTKPTGKVDFLYNGRYQNQEGPVESKISINSKKISNYHYKK